MRTIYRIFAAAVLVAATTACSAADNLVGPSKGDLVFRLDAQTCNPPSPVAFEFFVDGSSRGTASLSAGGTKSFKVDAGQHAIGATVANTTLHWQDNVTVPANGSFTFTMACS